MAEFPRLTEPVDLQGSVDGRNPGITAMVLKPFVISWNICWLAGFLNHQPQPLFVLQMTSVVLWLILQLSFCYIDVAGDRFFRVNVGC